MHSEQKGIILTLSYILIAGTANILIASYLKIYNQFAITLICFTASVLYFLIINIQSLNKIYMICKTHYKDFIKLNIYTSINWLSFYFALSILEPITSITIVHVVGTTLDNKRLISKNKYIYLYVVAVFLLFIHELMQNQMISSSCQIFLALFLSYVSGYSIFKITLLSKKFNDRGLVAGQVMLIRFFILIILCLILVSLIKENSIYLKPVDILYIICIGFLSIILPVYLLQTAYSLSKTNNILLTLSFAPVLIFFLQFFDRNIKFSSLVAMSIAIVSMVSMRMTFYKISKIR